jgi:hypothetical protein
VSDKVLINGVEPTHEELVYWCDMFEGPGRYPLQPAYPIAGNPEATPECSAHSGSCNTYRQHRDLAGEWMVAAVELGDDPFSYYYTNGVP